MGNIVMLDENTANKIAAGEVVERPASVVKELVENSIDAGANTISVEIKNGGISFIKITDNGSGIDEDDIEIAFERHATSKIRSAVDLESIATMGFRGEALASIAAVSLVELTTRTQKSSHGTYIKVQGGTTREVKQAGCPVGTTFIVRDLFFNTPARFKFLKKDSTEAGYISDIISRIALSKPDISFRLISNNTTIIHTPGNNDLLSTIYSIYGKEIAKEVCEISYKDNKVKITGYAGKSEIARGTRNHQSIFINDRYIKSKIVSAAIDEAYKTFLLKNKFAFIVLNIELNPLLIDVNVHPTKMEVRFSDEQEVFRTVYHAINNALLGRSLVKTVQPEEREKNPFKFESSNKLKPNYAQQSIEINTNIKHSSPSDYSVRNDGERLSGAKTRPMNETPEKEYIFEHSKWTSDQNKGETKSAVSNENIVTGDIIPKDNLIKDNNKIDLVEEQYQDKINKIAAEPEQDYKIEEKLDSSDTPVDDLFLNFRIIGQVFSTYILLQHNDELVLMDQHAAHERVMFESLRNKHSNRQYLPQMLLAPIVIELTNQEIKFLEEEKIFFCLQLLGQSP